MGAERAHFQRRNGMLQIINRAGRRSEMKNVIQLFFRQENEIGNVVLDEPIILVAGQMPDVLQVARDQIVDRDDAVAFLEQTIGQMRSEKAGAACDNGNGFGRGGHGACYLAAAPKFSEQKASENCRGPI